MEHGRQRETYCSRVSGNDKCGPLLNPNRKNYTSEKSSLSDSFEVPKSYGTTRNPLHPQCKVKLIGHVLEATDTLQGLAIKYGVTAEHLRRVNKLWTNDSIHLLRILKIPLNIDSQYYTEYVELSGTGLGPDGGISSGDELSNHVQRGKQKVGMLAENSMENSNEIDLTDEDKLSVGSYLDKLDARIKSSTQESEKLRTVSGPKLIADVEKANMTSFQRDDDLFRPLSTESTQSHRGQRLTYGRHKWKGKLPFQEEVDDKFFQL